jgi:CSLREA domain-containing protein
MKSKALRSVLMLALVLALALGAMPTSVVHAATITVTTTDDELNTDGDCSLREAIQAANTDAAVDACIAGSGADTINIPAGTCVITLAGNQDSNNLTGDLNIRSSLTLQGAGQATTILNGNGLDRILHVYGAYDVTVADLTITNGQAKWPHGGGNGGGIFASGTGTVTIRRCLTTNNRTDTGNNAGGGIWVEGGMHLIVDASTISDNWASHGGGGIAVRGVTSDLTLTNSTVKDNTTYSGGGLSIGDATAEIRNTTISGNEATSAVYGGGGIALAVGNDKVTIAHSTIVGNTSQGSGGGIRNQYAGSVTIRNTILANNIVTNPSYTGPDCYAPLISNGYNLVEDTTGCTFTSGATDITGSDPALGPLADNGGDTETHALLDGSPASNVIPGGTNGCGTTYTTDQRGVSRPQGASCDIGAFELVLDATPPVVTNVLADPNPAPVNTAITVRANVDDSSTGNSNIADAEYSLNGGAWTDMAPSDSSFDSPTEDVEATLSGFSEAGVHEVCVRGTDAAGNTSLGEDCTLLAVYDPAGAFVTGGGWIDSPVNADYPYMQVGGKANFGFVSKYKKGAQVPTGNTEFNFKAGGLNFHSDEYDWLVVNQGGTNAQYKGQGTINGTGAYKFMLWATDGDNKNPPEDDTFRIKIWYEDGDSEIVVYDNGFDQAIGGGNIKIHKAK